MRSAVSRISGSRFRRSTCATHSTAAPASVDLVDLLYFADDEGDQPEVQKSRWGLVCRFMAASGLTVDFTAMALSPLQIPVTLSILIWVTMITGFTALAPSGNLRR